MTAKDLLLKLQGMLVDAEDVVLIASRKACDAACKDGFTPEERQHLRDDCCQLHGEFEGLHRAFNIVANMYHEELMSGK